jgi:hypothetical protein
VDAREELVEVVEVPVQSGLVTKVHALEAEVAQLQGALTSRIVIEQAKGTISVTHGVGVEEAFETLRRHARSQRRNIHEVADEVVRNRGEFLTLPSKSKTALADELHRLLMRAADAAEELAKLAPNPAVAQLKARLAEAFVWLSAAAHGSAPTGITGEP